MERSNLPEFSDLMSSCPATCECWSGAYEYCIATTKHKLILSKILLHQILVLPCFALPSSGQRATLHQVSYIHIQLMSFEIPQAIWTKQRENIKALTRCRSKKARGQINAVPFRIRSSRFGAMSPALHSRRYYVGQSLVAPPFPVLPRWAHHRRFTFALQSLNFSTIFESTRFDLSPARHEFWHGMVLPIQARGF